MMNKQRSAEFYHKLSWVRFSILCLIGALTLYLAYLVFVAMPYYRRLQADRIAQQQQLPQVPQNSR